jgi:hypothetical protein
MDSKSNPISPNISQRGKSNIKSDDRNNIENLERLEKSILINKNNKINALIKKSHSI